MQLCFPFMHPRLLPEAARRAMPDSLLFLDPGLGDPGDSARFLPEAAPFDRRTARALLADTLRYGENAEDPHELAARALVPQAGALADEGSGRILDAVRNALLPGENGKATNAKAEDALLAARRQAQLLLLLAWNLEERLLDLRGIHADLRNSWDRLGNSVAESDDGDDAADREELKLGRVTTGMQPFGGQQQALPWRILVEPFALFAPADAVLCVSLPGFGEGLAEAGVAELSGAALPAGTSRAFRDVAWRVAGRKRAPADRPWLNSELLFAVFPAEE